jgi:hypothetical protein
MQGKARMAFCFYCLTIKIRTLGERTLLAQGGHSTSETKLSRGPSMQHICNMTNLSDFMGVLKTAS